tara:strand:+ start:145 stop:516 length:372 start_codon:yes stop_codon:yes gene_type:complete
MIFSKKTFTEFLKSPEKIATNILANRLDLLTKNGLLKFSKLPNDQKTKICYLTDSSIDLYPIIFEMIQWSHMNLDKNFGPVSQRIISKSKSHTTKAFIMRESSAYRSYRQGILAKAKYCNIPC